MVASLYVIAIGREVPMMESVAGPAGDLDVKA